VPEFDLCMTHPVAAMNAWHGGPGDGGHSSSDWYIQYGMDLGAPVGSEVRAAFTGRVSVFHRNPSETKPGVFGSQIFVRNSEAPADHMGAFYTHLQDVPASIDSGVTIHRGQFLGRVAPFSPPHLHFALVEIVGGLPGGTYVGVSSLNTFFKTTANAGTSRTIRFHQRAGHQPTVEAACAAPGATSALDEDYRHIEEQELGGDTRWLAAMPIQQLQRRIGNRAMGAALRSPHLAQAALALQRARPEGPLRDASGRSPMVRSRSATHP
jgi:murein DD-endopeptidase MepM/ murein hydrolase activator NlpD